ncbi:MAG: gephyrin-like molybdotransferase Glp [Pseudomonadota bacterium]
MSDHPKLVSIHAAMNLIASNRPVLAEERVALEACLGRTLAEDVIAKVTVPPLDTSAMDGYAVRFKDARSIGAKLQVIGEVAAGSPNTLTTGEGEAVRVFTGTPMPIGADHVLIQEHAAVDGELVTVASPQKEPRHIRKAGGDFLKGDTVLNRGTRLTAAHIGLAAAANHGSLSVHCRPRVAVLTTGSELRPPGSALSDGQIAESNSYTLSRMLEALGSDVVRLGAAPDTEPSIEAKILEASETNIILTVGGASVGKHDLVRTVFSKLGGKFVFQRIAVRPGKPTWFGTLGEQKVLGLPGNPTAAYVMASLLLKGLVSGATALAFTDAFLVAPLPANGPRETFVRGRLELKNGHARAYSLKDQDTSRVQALTSTNCLIHRPENDKEKSEGDLIQIVILDQ